MQIFSKQRGRPAKNTKWIRIKDIFFIFLGTVSAGALLLIFFMLWSFSSFLFLVPKSFDLLGMDEKKTYVVTLHNESELRPELGFLTGFLFVEIDKGEMKMEFHDSYDIAPPRPKWLAPDVIERRFSSDSRYQGWVFRDANFSPLHEQNARHIQNFLKYDDRYKNKKISGIISLDLHAIGKVLDSIGGVDFEGELYTSKNIFSLLEAEAKTFDRHSKTEWLSRKSSLQPLANAIIKKIAHSPFSWKSFSDTIETLGKEKHFQAWFANASIQKKFLGKKWAGSFPLTENAQDSFFLGHNFANLGGKKGDRYLQKHFTSFFSVERQNKISEKLTLQVQHQGTRNLNSDRYFAFVRLFRPSGTRLKSFTGVFDEAPVRVKNIMHKSLPYGEEFTFFFHIDESSEKNFSFDFTYPTRITDTNQKIFLLAQAGKISGTDTHTLIFQGIGDRSFAISGCDSNTVLENITRCTVDTAGDKTLFLTQFPDEKVPVYEETVIQQNGKVLRLQFSENIQDISLSEIFVQDPILGTKREISRIEMAPRTIIIYLKKSLDSQKRYLVHVDNVVDESGNTLTPFRMTVKRTEQKNPENL